MPPQLAVVNGAILKCDKGLTPSPLTVTTDPFVQINARPVATILDNQPLINVKPFGVCAITQKPCIPVTIAPWQPGAISILLASPVALLSDSSLLLCSIGGIIQVTRPGQTSVYVDSPNSSLYSLEVAETFGFFPPSDASLVYDDAGNVVGYVQSEGGVTKTFDVDGEMVDIREVPLEEVGDLDIAIGLATGGIGTIGRKLVIKAAEKAAARLAARKVAQETAEQAAKKGVERAAREAAERVAKSRAKSIRSYNERIAEHKEKLEKYVKNPDAYDNKGFLKNAPSPEIRQSIIDRRVKHLQKEIDTYKENIRKIQEGR